MEGTWSRCGRGVVGLGCRFIFLFEEEVLGRDDTG
jgi:hypothetical protein